MTAHASWAAHYDSVYRRCFGRRYDDLTTATLEVIRRLAPPPARVLDHGAGTGRLAIPLAQAGYGVTAVDPCVEMLDALRQKIGPDRVEVRVGRMRDALDGGPFDLALAVFTVVAYIVEEPELEASFAATAAALRAGGRLLLDVPGPALFRSGSFRSDDLVRDVRITPADGPRYRYQESTRLLTGTGWHAYDDSFPLRCWEPSHVLEIAERCGLSADGPLSELGDTGSDYYVLTNSRPP